MPKRRIVVAELGTPYLVGPGAAAIALASQHVVIRPTDLRRIRMSYFTMNGVVSLVLFTAMGISLVC